MRSKDIIFCIIISYYVALVYSTRPDTFEIHNVPYHRQITRYACGDASFEMVYHHYRQDLDQRAIIDVSRTSFEVGTNTFDLIRAAHFSELSNSAADYYYPEQAPQNGWKKSIPYGMVSFGYFEQNCWIDGLKDIISQGYPVIVLNHFSESSPGGHYRVAIGYDEDSITLLDPWDRMWPRIVKFTNQEFCGIWHIPMEYYNVTLPPYWAGFIAPLSVKVSFQALNQSLHMPDKYYNYINVNASISYPCPAPFCSPSLSPSEYMYTLSSFNVSINLPFNMKVINGEEMITFDSFYPTTSVYASWEVEIDDSIDVKFSSSRSSEQMILEDVIMVEAKGYVSGVVPEATCCFDKEEKELLYFPPYHYTDVVGEVVQIHF